MTTPHKTFMQRALTGEIDPVVYDSVVLDDTTTWHNSGHSEQRPLHEYLGMTWEEYGAWVRDSDAAKIVVDRLRSLASVYGATIDAIVEVVQCDTPQVVQTVQKYVEAARASCPACGYIRDPKALYLAVESPDFIEPPIVKGALDAQAAAEKAQWAAEKEAADLRGQLRAMAMSNIERGDTIVGLNTELGEAVVSLNAACAEMQEMLAEALVALGNVHGALEAANDVPVPQNETEYGAAIEQIIAQRNDARRILPRPPCGDAGCDGYVHLGARSDGRHTWCPRAVKELGQ